jgi:hypothetical protein
VTEFLPRCCVAACDHLRRCELDPCAECDAAVAHIRTCPEMYKPLELGGITELAPPNLDSD